MAELVSNCPDKPKMEQIWDFSDQFSVHFGSVSQNEQKTDLKCPRFVPFGDNLALFEAKSDIFCQTVYVTNRYILGVTDEVTCKLNDNKSQFCNVSSHF